MKKIKIVKFGANWCHPCRMMKPTIEGLMEKYNIEDSDVLIEDIDIDEDPETSSKFGIRGIPTTIFFVNEEIFTKRTGAISENQIEEIINEIKSNTSE